MHITFSAPSSSSLSRARRYTATYLPGVAPAQGWSRTQALLSLVRKAGYAGWRDVREGDAVWRAMRVQRYESRKVQVGWSEYALWKAAREGAGR